ncbi:MAG: terminase family protein, partial [Chloroflexota bacterium]
MTIAPTKLQRAYTKAQANLSAYKQIVKHDYQRAPHLDLLDAHLMACSQYLETGGERGINRLIIEMPPRHGKTLTTSQLYPTWHLGRNPDHYAMLVSYGATLAYDNSRASRNLIRDEYYSAMFPNTKLSTDRQAVDTWKVSGYEGGVNALGITGGATGKGAHLLIIDDPVKNRQEAESEVYRERTWSAFTSDLYTRLAPNGVIIIMATRWHMDDLTGRALQLDEQWTRLRLPALAEENDPLGRAVGDALWSDRYDAQYLAQVRNTLGEYEFASLYQQNPMPSKAGLFDTSKIEVIDSVPRNLEAVRFYDLAVTAKKTSDYTAGVKLGKDSDGNIYILHMYRVQKNPVDVKNDIIQNAQLDGTRTHIRLETENSGLVQLDYLLRDSALSAYTIDGVRPQGDKYTRAQPFASRVNAG